MLAYCNDPFSKFTSIKYFPKIKALLKKKKKPLVSAKPIFDSDDPLARSHESCPSLFFKEMRRYTLPISFLFLFLFHKSSVKIINHFPLPLLPAKILFPTDSNFKPITWFFTTKCEPIHWIQIHTNPRSRIAQQQQQQWLRSLSTLWSVESVQRFEP